MEIIGNIGNVISFLQRFAYTEKSLYICVD